MNETSLAPPVTSVCSAMASFPNRRKRQRLARSSPASPPPPSVAAFSSAASPPQPSSLPIASPSVPLPSPHGRIYASDRFIPSRTGSDMEYCRFMLETSPSSSSSSSSSSTSHTSRTGNEDAVSSRPLPRQRALQRHTKYTESLAAALLHSPPRVQRSLLCFQSPHDQASSSSWRRPSSCSRVLPSWMDPFGGLSSFSISATYSPCSPSSSSSSPPSVGIHQQPPVSASRILDAPELRNDYYLNLVAWGSHDVLAVALAQVVYLYSPTSGALQELRACSMSHDYVTAVAWLDAGGGGGGGVGVGGERGERGAGARLAVGTFLAELQVWDTATGTKLRSLRGHRDRIGTLAYNGVLLTSGSRDASIRHHDLRLPSSSSSTSNPSASSRTSSAVVATLRGHEQEVCGLAWSPDGKLLASGGNDNCLCLWDATHLPSSSSSSSSSASSSPRQRVHQHRAAVKALAWCPWERHVLASGGGTADRTIKCWHTGHAHTRLLQSVDTGSQVCGLIWALSTRELLSSHGFSQHELCLWSYPTLTRLREFTGHTARVLHLARSPDGRSVVSAAADETIRFWNVFAPSSSRSYTYRHQDASPLHFDSIDTTASRRSSARRRLFQDAVIR